MNPIRIVITDFHSALGTALAYEFEREAVTLLGADLPDWRDSDAVMAYIRHHQPAIIINIYGCSDLYRPGQVEALREVAENLAQACAVYQIPLLHLSSYLVFGNENKNIHNEKDETQPLTPLGQAFLAAEQLLDEHLQKWIGLRVSWLIGCEGNNLLTHLLTAIFEDRRVCGVNASLRGAPTPLVDIARVCAGIVKQVLCGSENWGIMHYCSAEACTEADFARQVLQTLEQLQLYDENIQLEIVDDAPADEPTSAVLGCRRVRDGFGVQARAWRPVLLPMIRQWVEDNHQPVDQDKCS